MKHIVLAGDSILDNGVYVGAEPSVIAQLQAKLSPGDTATLLAVDGDCVGDVAPQLTQLPQGATHLVISAGGNDALGQAGLLQEPASSFAEVLTRLSQIAESFGADYRAMLRAAQSRELPILLCTIYDANFPDAATQRVIEAALGHFNDRILREAIFAQVPVLDLRAICTERADYANEIEPSSRGGEKITSAILAALSQHDFSTSRCTIYGAVS